MLAASTIARVRPLHLMVAASSALALSAVALAQPSYNVVQLGLGGSTYTNNVGNVSQSVTSINVGGFAVGTANRFNGGSTSLGSDVWGFNGTSSIFLGFSGGAYLQNNGTQNNRLPILSFNFSNQMNASGQVTGATNRYSNGTSTQVGSDGWFFDGTNIIQVGYYGAGTVYEFNNAGVINRATNTNAVLADGRVLGSSNRFSTTGTSAGTDVFLETPSLTSPTRIQLGLTGPGYTFTPSGSTVPSQTSSVTIATTGSPVNNNGYVTGTSSRFSSTGTALGADAWLYNGTTSTAIGLTGAAYANSSTGSRTSAVQGINANNQVVGTTNRFSGTNGLGNQAWVYTPSTNSYAQFGLSGPGLEAASGAFAGQRTTNPIRFNDAGQVAGTQQQYSGNTLTGGTVGLYFNGSSTVQIGLTAAIYQDSTNSGAYSTSINNISNNTSPGAATYVAGGNTRYSGATVIGADAWQYSSITGNTSIISPTSSVVTSSTNARTSLVRAMNDLGVVIGTSVYYNGGAASLGTIGWIYDPSTTTTSLIQWPSFSSTGQATTTPRAVGATGVVVGDYTAYDALGVSLGSRVFLWTLAGGFLDLGLNTANLSAAGYQFLATNSLSAGTGIVGNSAYSNYPLLIAGAGQVNGQTTAGRPFLATQVPGPAGAIALGMFGVLASTRRRQR